ncbi:MAG: 3-oxoacyl-[acyl-carrier-protein] reductase [Anaerolineae bacterium]
MQLKDKVAIVTGGSRGIGRAIALELARRGAKVVVNYNASAGPAEEVVSAIKASGGEAMAVKADVSKFDEAQALIKSATEAYGRLDVLVNNAGTTRDMLLALMKEEDWDTVLATNLKSAFNCCKAALRPMMRQKYGRIVNITSVAGVAGNAGQTNYSASKAGMIGFTKSLAKEVGSRNITVNAVAPGFVETDLTKDLPAELKEAAIKVTPLGRWGTCEDVAHAVAFMASDEAAFITGQTLSIDGGMVMQ